MPITSHFRDLLSRKVFGGDATAIIPSSYYVGLSTTKKTNELSTFTEPSGNGYTRVEISNVMASFAERENGVANNADAVEFPESTAAWGSIVQAGLFDAATGGNLLSYSDLDVPRNVGGEGVTLFFKANSMDFAIGDINWSSV